MNRRKKTFEHFWLLVQITTQFKSFLIKMKAWRLSIHFGCSELSVVMHGVTWLFLVWQVVKMLILVVVLFLLCWGPRLAKYLQRLCFTFFPRFIMETTLKMQIVQFNNAVYWVRVVIFLLPFLHSISEIWSFTLHFTLHFKKIKLIIYISKSIDLCGYE